MDKAVNVVVRAVRASVAGGRIGRDFRFEFSLPGRPPGSLGGFNKRIRYGNTVDLDQIVFSLDAVDDARPGGIDLVVRISERDRGLDTSDQGTGSVRVRVPGTESVGDPAELTVQVEARGPEKGPGLVTLSLLAEIVPADLEVTPGRVVRGQITRLVIRGPGLTLDRKRYRLRDLDGRSVGTTLGVVSQRSTVDLLGLRVGLEDGEAVRLDPASGAEPPQPALAREVLIDVRDSVPGERVRLVVKTADGERSAELGVESPAPRPLFRARPSQVPLPEPPELPSGYPDLSWSFVAKLGDGAIGDNLEAISPLVLSALGSCGGQSLQNSAVAEREPPHLARLGIVRVKDALNFPRSSLATSFGPALSAPPLTAEDLRIDEDGDGLPDRFEERLAGAFRPLYHFSAGEAGSTGFTDFRSGPQCREPIGPVIPLTEPLVFYRVKPLGISSLGGRRTALLQVDYFTPWNRDDGLTGDQIAALGFDIAAGALTFRNDLIGGIIAALAGSVAPSLIDAGVDHDLDEEYSSVLFAAEGLSPGESYPTDPARYQLVEVFTAAHEGTLFDHSAYTRPAARAATGLVDPDGIRRELNFELYASRAKHSTYPMDPDGITLFSLVIPVFVELGLVFITILQEVQQKRREVGEFPIIEFVIRVIVLTLVLVLAFGLIFVERFVPRRLRGVPLPPVPIATLEHVGEPSPLQSINGATWINEPKSGSCRGLSAKFTVPTWRVRPGAAE